MKMEKEEEEHWLQIHIVGMTKGQEDKAVKIFDCTKIKINKNKQQQQQYY